MYIFKQANGGDEVTCHQDSTFLHTEPRLTCLGLWLALQDATLENGCIWARPGSHKEGLRRQFVRNPEYFEKGRTDQPLNVFKNLDTTQEACKWESTIPQKKGQSMEEGVRSVGFEPFPCKAGDLVLIHG